LKTILISFSGLDGAGKTTHINLTKSYLEGRGHRVKVLRMYDHISVSALLRKRLWRRKSRSASRPEEPRSEPSRSASQEPVAKTFRLDKNRKGPVIVTLRQVVYLVDLCVFVGVTFFQRRVLGQTIICDRHLIDSIVNLADSNRFAESYSRFMLTIIPKPDVPILIDLDAEVAFERKPEYPLVYNLERRQAYLRVFRRLKGAFVVPSTTIPEVQERIERRLEAAT